MNYTQNSKIAQVTERTLVIGVDIGSEMNYARAFNWRGQELSKKVFRFSNSQEGLQSFSDYLRNNQAIASAEQIIVGCEPTVHYWFTLAKYLKAQHINLALVNPYHVKQIKELDDNSPKKTDQKDPKTIAKLVADGRYSYPYLPEGIYADLREAVSSRERIVEELNAVTNRLKRWLKIYFPEYLTVYKKFSSESGLTVLETAPLPQDVVKLGADGINHLWREKKLCGWDKEGADPGRSRTEQHRTRRRCMCPHGNADAFGGLQSERGTTGKGHRGIGGGNAEDTVYCCFPSRG